LWWMTMVLIVVFSGYFIFTYVLLDILGLFICISVS